MREVVVEELLELSGAQLTRLTTDTETFFKNESMSVEGKMDEWREEGGKF